MQAVHVRLGTERACSCKRRAGLSVARKSIDQKDEDLREVSAPRLSNFAISSAFCGRRRGLRFRNGQDAARAVCGLVWRLYACEAQSHAHASFQEAQVEP
eukprot:6149644-Pleurochrysis_carterae.AAC.3